MFSFNLRILGLVFLIVNNNTWAAEKTSPEKNSSRVFEEHGNIYCTINNKVTQITIIGKDKYPSLSPNKKTIAFVRRSDTIMSKKCGCISYTGSDYTNQVWVYDITTRKEKLLVKNNFLCDEPEKMIVDPSNLQFSPDSSTLYFTVSARPTSGALRAINIDGTSLRYLASANSYRVVYSGKYKNRLIIWQHRYFPQGGSYDWYWLYTLQGKQIKTLGPMD